MRRKTITRAVALKFLADPFAVDLDSYGAIEAAAAELLAKCPFALELAGLKELPDAAATALGKRMAGDLDLSGLKALSVVAAKALAGTEGILMLAGLETISDEVAEALSRHEGILNLSGLTTLSRTAAKSLAKVGELVVGPGVDAAIAQARTANG